MSRRGLGCAELGSHRDEGLNADCYQSQRGRERQKAEILAVIPTNQLSVMTEGCGTSIFRRSQQLPDPRFHLNVFDLDAVVKLNDIVSFHVAGGGPCSM
jgi:hypothetical protein